MANDSIEDFSCSLAIELSIKEGPVESNLDDVHTEKRSQLKFAMNALVSRRYFQHKYN